VTRSAWAQARARILRVCDRPADARSLRIAVLAEIRRVVGFDAYAWLLTDPQSSVGASPLADVPCLPELPRLIRLKYLTEVNRWTRMSQPVALLTVATDGDRSRSLMWREMLSDYGIDDIASSVYRDQYGCWGFLDLWRTSGSFTADEAAFLTDIAAPVTAALRRAQASTFVDVHERSARGPIVLVLSPDLDVRAQTPQTQEYLRVLLPPDGGSSPVPASAYNVGAQLLANEAGVDANPPWARVHLAGGHWLTLRAARLAGTGPAHQRDLAISIEETTPAERAALYASAHCLSARESELLAHLVTGTDTHELAHRMSLSHHTVQDHLKSIFVKTGVNSRRVLLSRALGT
jgi:DNA-binding CsgD family transcriptional regulator